MKWISVEERLPILKEARGLLVYIYSKSKGLKLAHFDTIDNEWWTWKRYFEEVEYFDDVTHWMPLPELPQ